MVNIDRNLKSYLNRNNRSDRLNYVLDVTKGILVGILFMIMIYQENYFSNQLKVWIKNLLIINTKH